MTFREDYLAEEARRLLADTVLNHALALMRTEALEAMLDADAGDPIKVMRAQCAAKAVTEFKDMLGRFIEALPTQD